MGQRNQLSETENVVDLLRSTIRDVLDFPKKGIVFKDITPVLQDSRVFKAVIDAIIQECKDKSVTSVAGIESRGFIFAAPVAKDLGLPLILIRKKGKLPYKTVEASYDLEYGSATIEMHIDSVKKGDRVLVVDDLLATGGTVEAACKLIEGQGGDIVECFFIVELGFLKGREKIKAPISSLITY